MDLYEAPSWLVALLLLAVILMVFEAGHRAGQWHQAATDEEIQPQTSAIQGSVLGLLALLLGFTFSMSVGRYEQRNAALVDEANAIGTVQLRTALLPPAEQAAALQRLNDYVRLRLDAAALDATQQADRDTVQAEAVALQNALWAQASRLAMAEPSARLNLYLSALNDMFDAQATRLAVVERHVPTPVTVLMLFTLLAVTGFAGYTGGLSGGRPLAAMVLLSLLLVLVIYVIFDLDRPRRGLIQVDQAVMEALLVTPTPGR